MWPVLLDMTKDESIQILRNLELEAYSHLVSALRAQGPLNSDKRKLLKDTSQVLNIPQDRHKAEIRRAVNDEKLTTIAYHVAGCEESMEDWAQEGRRPISTLPRMAPQTVYSAIADEVAETACQTNKQLPHPALTERKRPLSQPSVPMISDTTKGLPFRIPETPKNDDNKKRKHTICPDNSSLAQHLLGSPKISRTPQVYRQRTKSGMLKEQMKMKPLSSKLPFTSSVPPSPSKINVIQNLVINPSQTEESSEIFQNELNNHHLVVQKTDHLQVINPNESQTTRLKVMSPLKPVANLAFKHLTANTSSGPTNNDFQKTMKVGAPKRTSAKQGPPLPFNQKLIVVSNAQTTQSNSILQKTLSVPLMKNISMKNLEKFKIVTTTSSQISISNNVANFKPKMVTVKTNPASQKVIPLSMLNSRGAIKVLPIGGKIIGRNTTSTTSQPIFIVNTMPKQITQSVVADDVSSVVEKENEQVGSVENADPAKFVSTTMELDCEHEITGHKIMKIPSTTENFSQSVKVEQGMEEKEQSNFLIIHEGDQYMKDAEAKSDSDNVQELDSVNQGMIMKLQNTELCVSEIGN